MNQSATESASFSPKSAFVKATLLGPLASLSFLAACEGDIIREGRKNWERVISDIDNWQTVTLPGGKIQVGEHPTRRYVVVRPERGKPTITANQLTTAIRSVTNCSPQFEPGILTFAVPNFTNNSPFPLNDRMRVDQTC